MKRLHIVARGRVQGVWYRAFSQRHAQDLGLHGWARNLADGAVELVAEGEADRLESFLDALREGPPASDVQELFFEEEEPDRTISSFEIRPNGSADEARALREHFTPSREF